MPRVLANQVMVSEEQYDDIERRVDLVRDVWEAIIDNEDNMFARLHEVIAHREALLRYMSFRKSKIAKYNRMGAIGSLYKAKLALAIFLRDWVNDQLLSTSSVELYEYMDEIRLGEFIGELQRLKSLLYSGKAHYEIIVKLLDPHKAAATPLAWRILTAIRNHLEMMKQGLRTSTNVGYRFTISSPLGAGKTSISVVSTIVALRFAGVPDSLIKEYIQYFVVNNPMEIIQTLAAVERASQEGLLVPVIVYDDAAVTLSKYQQTPVVSDKYEQRIAARISELMQIAREGAGLYVFVTSDTRALMKMLRETTEYQLSGDTVKGDILGLTETYTIWQEVSYEETLEENPLGLPFRKRPKKIVDKRQRLITITATVSPPLFTPIEVYEPLRRMKSQLRMQRIMDIYRAMKEKREEEGTKEAEEEMEEEIVREEE